MLNVSIDCKGKTVDDIIDAINEAKQKIENGFTQGFDRNETGSYCFSVSGEEELEEVED